VESIRSRASSRADQLIEISETGTRMTDPPAPSTSHQRGALILSENALPAGAGVSVDGEERHLGPRLPLEVDGDRFLLGDAAGAGTRTCRGAADRRTRRARGMSDLDPQGTWSRCARRADCTVSARRIRGRSVDRTSEGQATREIRSTARPVGVRSGVKLSHFQAASAAASRTVPSALRRFHRTVLLLNLGGSVETTGGGAREHDRLRQAAGVEGRSSPRTVHGDR